MNIYTILYYVDVILLCACDIEWRLYTTFCCFIRLKDLLMRTLKWCEKNENSWIKATSNNTPFCRVRKICYHLNRKQKFVYFLFLVSLNKTGHLQKLSFNLLFAPDEKFSFFNLFLIVNIIYFVVQMQIYGFTLIWNQLCQWNKKQFIHEINPQPHCDNIQRIKL